MAVILRDAPSSVIEQIIGTTDDLFSDHASEVSNMRQDIDFRIIESIDGFHALESEWTSLFEKASSGPQAFQSFSWLKHWVNHFLANEHDGKTTLSILLVFQNNTLKQIWPLIRCQKGPVEIVSWMGEPVSQYCDVIAERGPGTETLLHAAWDYLNKTFAGSVFELRRVRADAQIAPLLKNINAPTFNERAAPYSDLAQSADFSDIEKKHISGNRRRNRNRQRRRLTEVGGKPTASVPNGDRASELVAAAIEMKRAWLKQRALPSSAIRDPRTTTFFRDVFADQSVNADTYVLAMETDDHPVAIQVGLVHRGHISLHIISHDAEYNRMAAGSLMNADSLQFWHAAGAKTFDFLAPADEYKLEWADGTIDVADYVIPSDAVGHAYSFVENTLIRGYAYKTFLSLPTTVRQRVMRALKRA